MIGFYLLIILTVAYALFFTYVMHNRAKQARNIERIKSYVQ